ncbi:ABC transporter substrate-binding protein [Sulfuriflexus sp.]|uniref:ABC transporter substrate-binding protein n=1 Tax=Sulfuriflexus sp. TaxID=2015443 RepID=UPI0028CD2F7B|nr:ABC transporter substrate-binding protein [Sulfuriflexus sp.]MDT8403404.1 ABC transporter substrate-binding protein [Sulfuriflexus sp.]
MLAFWLGGCGEGNWNNPYPQADSKANVLYSSFEERPKHLDPAVSYSATEYQFIAQIYTPPLQYHYLKRPYTLIPLAAAKMPRVRYLDEREQTLPATAESAEIAFSEYIIEIRPGMRYQPHPAFARDEQGRFLYHALSEQQLDAIYTLADFAQTGTRELVAEDFVYQIKRLAHPGLHSPIFGVMSDYIVGLPEYAKTLKQARERETAGLENKKDYYLDLKQYPLAGVSVLDRYRYRIRIKGKYPQLVYWLSMPFFAPLPVEADRFYSQAGLVERNISLDWYPVGTGPYMLTVNNPNLEMVLERNPYFDGEVYPGEGEPGDAEAGLLVDAGAPLPFIDKVVYRLERETIPYWSKFLQGYYDSSGISSDSFDEAVSITTQGEPTLTEEMEAMGIQLQTAVTTSTFYTGFNMLDPVVGGDSQRARLLRRAIAIATDYEEFISIFNNGRGLAAQGPLPPGLFGYREGKAGINPYVYDWVNGRPKRKSIEEARRLLARAGYPNGIDRESGEALVINLDTAASGPDAKARLDWWRKQFRKLNIDLVIRSTDYNRFQDKMRNGTAQIFQWGWNADYPDPENFMFLLYGPNSKVGKSGENAANYDNAEFNALFDRMKNMDNGPARQAIIDAMVDIARRDGPWLWGLHPKAFSLHHAWYKNSKPNLMANNTLKYKRIEPELRAKQRMTWNKPVTWPLWTMLLVFVALILPGIISYRRKEHGIGGSG